MYDEAEVVAFSLDAWRYDPRRYRDAGWDGPDTSSTHKPALRPREIHLARGLLRARD